MTAEQSEPVPKPQPLQAAGPSTRTADPAPASGANGVHDPGREDHAGEEPGYGHGV